MNDDAALLRRFVDEPSAATFSELVGRHVDLVYSVALRQLAGEAEAALGVTQEVFSELATTAAAVSRRAVIVGWLHGAARRLAAKDAAPESAGEDGLRRVDEALDHLAEEDRTALLLHYFERRPLEEVGIALHLSAEAAGLATGRAAEKLRGRLAFQGHRLGAAAMLSLLEAQTLSPAPMGTVDRITTVALNAAALAEVGGGKSSLLGGLVGLVNSGVALGVAAAIAIGAALLWGYRNNERLEAELTRVREDAQILAGLQRDNRRMARSIADADELRREVVELPALRATVRSAEPAAPIGAVSLTVTVEGKLRWENEEITAEELLVRLVTFRARYPSPESSIFIRGGGAALSAVNYVVNETRKAGIRQVLVDGDPRPDRGANAWF